MAECAICGRDHTEDAVTAAVSLDKILNLLSEDEGLSPDVLLHVVGFLGALLVHYSDYNFTEVVGEIARIAKDEAELETLRGHMKALGLAVDDADQRPH